MGRARAGALAALAPLLLVSNCLAEFDANLLDDTMSLVKARLEISERDLGELSSMYSQGVLRHETSDNNDDVARGVLYSMMRQQHYRSNFSSVLWYGLVFWHSEVNFWVYGPEPGNYLEDLRNTTYPKRDGRETYEGLLDQGDRHGCPLGNDTMPGGLPPLPEYCMKNFWIDKQTGAGIEPWFGCYTYKPWDPSRPSYPVWVYNRSVWLNAAINLWSNIPFIGGSTFLYNRDQKPIGLASVSVAVSELETLLRMKVESLNKEGRLYIVTGDSHNLVLASAPGVAWVAKDAYTPGAPINVLNCTDEVIRHSARELSERQWVMNQLFTSKNGRFHISARSMRSASYRMGFETDWVFVVVQEINCPVGYKAMPDGSPLEGTCAECPVGRTSPGGQSTTCVCGFGYFEVPGGCAKCPPNACCFGEGFLPIPKMGYWSDRSNESFRFAAESSGSVAPFEVRARYVYPCELKTNCRGVFDPMGVISGPEDGDCDEYTFNVSNQRESCWHPDGWAQPECWRQRGCRRNQACYNKSSPAGAIECWRKPGGCDNDDGNNHGSPDRVLCSKGSAQLLCGKCEQGFVLSPTGSECMICKKNKQYVWTAIFVAVFVLIWILAVMQIKFNWVKKVKKFLFVALLESHYDIGTLKVCWGAYQIISSIGFSLQITFPEPFQGMVVALTAITQFDIGDGIGLPCYDSAFLEYHLRVLVSSGAPIGIAVIIWFVYFLRKSRAPDEETELKIYSEHNEIFLLLTYLVYPTVTMLQLKRLSYKSVDTFFDSDNELGYTELGSYLDEMKDNFEEQSEVTGFHDKEFKEHMKVTYLRVQPSNDWAEMRKPKKLWEIIPLIILYQLIPLMYLFFLVRVRDRLEAEKHSLRTPSGRLSTGRLHAARQTTAISRNDAVLRPLKFLTHAYTQNCWWFDVVDLIRRAIYIGVLPLFETLSERAIYGCLLSLVFLMIHTNVKPYAVESTNTLAELSDYQVFFTFFMALLLNADVVDFSHRVGIALCLVNLLVVLSLVWIAVKAAHRLSGVQHELKEELDRHHRAFAPASSNGYNMPPEIQHFCAISEIDDVAETLLNLEASDFGEKSLLDNIVTTVLIKKNLAKNFGIVTSERQHRNILDGGMADEIDKAKDAADEQVRQLHVKVGPAIRVVENAIEERLVTKDVVLECDAVIAAAKVLTGGLMRAAWTLIEVTEPARIREYEVEIEEIKKGVRGTNRQFTKEVVPLYEQGARAWSDFDSEMRDVAKKTMCEVHIPEALKSVGRIIERTIFSRKDPGNRNCDVVCDVVRCLFIGKNMSRLADLLAELHRRKNIVVVNVKEGFLNDRISFIRPTTINFYLQGDPHRHICEAQLTHQRLLQATSSCGKRDHSMHFFLRPWRYDPERDAGRRLYEKTRNAAELLGKLGLSADDERDQRPTEIAKLRAKGVTLKHMVHIGCSGASLLAAGFEQSELKAVGITVRRSVNLRAAPKSLNQTKNGSFGQTVSKIFFRQSSSLSMQSTKARELSGSGDSTRVAPEPNQGQPKRKAALKNASSERAPENTHKRRSQADLMRTSSNEAAAPNEGGRSSAADGSAAGGSPSAASFDQKIMSLLPPIEHPPSAKSTVDDAGDVRTVCLQGSFDGRHPSRQGLARAASIPEGDEGDEVKTAEALAGVTGGLSPVADSSRHLMGGSSPSDHDQEAVVDHHRFIDTRALDFGREPVEVLDLEDH